MWLQCFVEFCKALYNCVQIYSTNRPPISICAVVCSDKEQKAMNFERLHKTLQLLVFEVFWKHKTSMFDWGLSTGR